MARQNELRAWVVDLASKDFTPSHVRDNPLIYSGRAVKRLKATPAGASGNKDNAVAPQKDGDITVRQNELRDGVADLEGKDFTPSHVRDDPLIYSSRAVKRLKAMPARARENKDHAVEPQP